MLAELVRVVATFLAEAGLFCAALKHLELEEQLARRGQPRRPVRRCGRSRATRRSRPGRRTRTASRRPRSTCRRHMWARFAERWGGPAKVSGPRPPRPSSCSRPTVRALRPSATWGSAGSGWATTRPRPPHFAARSRGPGATPEAVDLEALCQQIAPLGARRHGRAGPVDLAAARPASAARDAPRRSHRSTRKRPPRSTPKTPNHPRSFSSRYSTVPRSKRCRGLDRGRRFPGSWAGSSSGRRSSRWRGLTTAASTL